MKCKVCERVFSNQGGLAVHEVSCQKVFVNRDEIRRLYSEELFSIRELCSKYDVGKGIITKIVGDLVRSYSESAKIGKKKFTYSHTEESKEKLRKKRLEFLKNNPEKTAWRTKNISYPEKLFINKFELLEWQNKYSIVRELSVFPFYIDFAFINEMVAVEIDGSQHLQQDRSERDKKKDALLNEKGWVVVRISEKEIKKNIEETFEKLEKILLSSSKEIRYEFGILEFPKVRQKKERQENGLTEAEIDRIIKSRKVVRPSYEEINELVEEIGFVATGKIYGVSDNAIRKWLKFYLKYGK